MQIQHHIAKISWTIADKTLYVIYGFVFLLQISLLPPSDLALFNFLIAINTWMFVISDSFALQPIIQFGFVPENLRKVNLYSLLLHLIIITVLSAIIFIFKQQISGILSEPRILEITYYLPFLSLFMIPRTYCLKLMLRDHAMNKIFITNFAFFGIMVFRILRMKFSASSISLDDAVMIYLEGTALSSAIAFILTFNKIKLSITGNIRLKEIVNFSLPFTMTNSLLAIPKYLDIVFLKLFFPLDQIGIYSAAKSLFKFFEEGMHGVNGLVYPAAVRAITNKDKEALQSMISKAISFTFIGFIAISLILILGFAEFLIGTLMKSNFINSIDYFKMILIASLFLPFNILYFVITASSKHLELLKIVFISFIFSLLSFLLIGLSGISLLMPLGYVSFYFAFAIQSIYYVNHNGIVHIGFEDLFRGINDSFKYVLKRLNKS